MNSVGGGGWKSRQILVAGDKAVKDLETWKTCRRGSRNLEHYDDDPSPSCSHAFVRLQGCARFVRCFYVLTIPPYAIATPEKHSSTASLTNLLAFLRYPLPARQHEHERYSSGNATQHRKRCVAFLLGCNPPSHTATAAARIPRLRKMGKADFS